MKHINTFEKFSNKTITSNNLEYDAYYKKHKDKSRAGVVAWVNPSFQEENFRIVADYVDVGDSILDYGCGIGDFIRYIKPRKQISDYLGVDINPKFIDMAKKSYQNNNFQLIKSVDEITGKFDTVCAIGVFTWYITEEDFVKTINRLCEVANKQVILTLLWNRHEDTAEDVHFWDETYRYYDKSIFDKLFPELDIDFKVYDDHYLMVRINK